MARHCRLWFSSRPNQLFAESRAPCCPAHRRSLAPPTILKTGVPLPAHHLLRQREFGNAIFIAGGADACPR